MKSLLAMLMSVISITAMGQAYYIVRHAEKEQLSSGNSMQTVNNPPLSTEGKKRAIELEKTLRKKHIYHIFSTNTLRTMSTASPLSETIHVPIENYADANQEFIAMLKNLHQNVLIVGHSNTIDDIANALSNKMAVSGDIADSVYNNLFIVKKKGEKFIFKAKIYGR